MACLSRTVDVKSLIDLVHQQCLFTPESIAIKTTSHTLTYKELWKEVNEVKTAISTFLPTDEAQKDIVGINLPNSKGYIVSLLSIIGCNWAFLPLPVDMPKERLLSFLNDACVSKVMTDSDDLSSSTKVLLKHTIAGEDIVLFDLQKSDTDEQKCNQMNITNDKCKTLNSARREDFSYVIYTSGSTGKPKGVKVKESSVINVAKALINACDIGQVDVIAQFASIGFDASIAEIFTSLLSGASLAILGDHERLGEKFIQSLNEMSVTVITLPPSVLNVYSPESFQTLQKIVSAGEVCNSRLAEKWAASDNIRFFNAYGPTEGTVCASNYEYIPSKASSNTFEDLPIGKAIDGVKVYLLDESLNEVQSGIVGEIYIGGKGVAYGYIGHAQYLNVNRFIENPFVDVPARLFKTGDYAVEDDDGNIYFMGRDDDQVKIRGHRIDLKEIEETINKHKDIDIAIVVVHKCMAMKDNFLAAFIMSASIDIAELRSDLLKVLPKYMIPIFFKRLKESHFPKTLNGKIDRKSLEKDESVHEQSHSCNTNLLSEEEYLAAKHWATVFKFEESAIYYLNKETSFQELGGDSLQLVRLQRLIEDDLKQTVPFTEISKADTLADLAELIRQFKVSNTSHTKTATQSMNKTDTLRRLIIEDSELGNDVFQMNEITEYSQSNDTQSALPYGATNIMQPRNILLSGVTGFLGTFILSELLEQTDFHVFCMVRATCKAKGLSRIIDSMNKYNLWKSKYVLRITVIESDLTQQRFGLSKNMYSMLENKVDVVFMNGAEVNMNKSYEELRSANVHSTKEGIKLASSGTRKYLFFTSSLSVFLFPPHDSDKPKPCRRVCSEAEFLDDPLLINGGYGQSKWAAERLVMQALEGLPGGAIFRPARITGRSTDGACPKNDLFTSILFGMKRLGFYPDLDFPYDMVPVDYCAKAIVEILVQICSVPKENMATIYHLYNKDTIPFTKLFEDMNLKPCPLSEWRQKLLSTEDDDQQLVPLTPFLMSAFWDNTMYWPVFDTSNTDTSVSESTRKLMKPLEELLITYKTFHQL